MTTFFIGCTHFGHSNIINLAKRPFKDVHEMDMAMVDRWNAKVQPNDIVWHLGDFAWDSHDGYFQWLNGRKRLVIGNHDSLDVAGMSWDQVEYSHFGKVEGQAVIGTLSRRTVKIMDAYIAGLGFDLHEDAPIFRQLNGRPFKSKDLSDEFRLIRDLVFPGDNRLMLDIRRSGAVEALAGQVELSAIAAKMGNTIDVNKKLQETYLPRRAATVRLVDEARKRGRQILKDEE